MAQQIPINPDTKIVIDIIGGDLSLVGWEKSELLVRADEDEVRYQQSEGQFTLSCDGDLSLRVPQAIGLSIQTVGGDAAIRNLTGKLEINAVQGDVSLREVNSVSIGSVESDFSLRGAKGDVLVRGIGGDASLREVNGSLTLDSVSDDLAVRGVGGNLNVNVDEDVVVHLDPKPGQEYYVLAGDDILLVLPPDASATLTLHGDEIQVDWPGISQEGSTSRTVVLGDGSAKINLNAGGDLVVTSRVDAAESATEYGNFAGMMFDWGGFGRDLGESISRRAKEAADRAARKTEAAGRRMERQLERQFGRHSSRRGGRFSWSWDPSQMPNAPKSDPVSDEERMTILRMLADKKITSEEAEKLLSALEGGQ
jgi:hypothetical protein